MLAYNQTFDYSPLTFPITFCQPQHLQSWRLFGLTPVDSMSLTITVNNYAQGGSPCVVIMGDDSCLRGGGFESWSCTLDGHDISSN